MDFLSFSKMHGAGNDFIVADDQDYIWPRDPQFIKQICNRQRGIGADGFVIISTPQSRKLHKSMPCFKMDFYNCDGAPADMCGNGLRCAALYAKKYLTDSDLMSFETGAGSLEARLLGNGKVQIQIPLIKAPEKVLIDKKDCFSVNTGVPHLIVPVDNPAQVDVKKEGRYLRNLSLFHPEGTNVNFISIPENTVEPVTIRTYERGVENETFACGTGIAGAAVTLIKFFNLFSPIDFITKDKDTISIDFSYNANIVDGFQNIVLIGPAEEIFRGKYKNS